MKIPKKINLAHLPTPIEKIKYHSKEFLIKRDDYTGSDFLGNKIRKLEFLQKHTIIMCPQTKLVSIHSRIGF